MNIIVFMLGFFVYVEMMIFFNFLRSGFFEVFLWFSVDVFNVMYLFFKGKMRVILY